MSKIQKGALVYYKSKPAVVSGVSDKIDILFFKTTKRVRDKDIKLLHPGPIKDVAMLDLECPKSLDTLDETLALLEDEAVSLADLAEFLYGDFTPQTAWSSWMLVMDDLYFELVNDGGDSGGDNSGNEQIKARPLDFITEEKQKRDAKRNQKEAWNSLIERIKSGNIEEDDHTHLVEVEQLACDERENSRILKTIGISETKEAAHTLLLRLGYWKEEYNPWPRRMGINMTDPQLDIPPMIETEREDLQHLKAWAIDDIGNQDPDDAISIEGNRLWVHIADVSSIVTPNSELDVEARSRGTNLYLPDRTVHMLPKSITAQLGLGLHETSPALSISFSIADSGELEDIDVCFSTISVTRTTYDDVDNALDSSLDSNVDNSSDNKFAELKALTDIYNQRRVDNNAAMLELPEVNIHVKKDGEITVRPYSRGGSRQIVAECMLAAGEAIALFATKNNIPIPYAQQPEPEEIQYPEKPSEHYAYRRCFKASRHTTEPEAHFGLGLPCYTRVTSPMRRYLDLFVHQQLRAFLTNKETEQVIESDEKSEHEALIERIGLADEGSRAARKAERSSNQHWTLLYLKQYQEKHGKAWQGDAIIAMHDERKTSLLLPDLALEPKIRVQNHLELNQVITVEAQSINIPDLWAGFRVV